MPPFSWVSWVEASPYDPAVAYAAFDRHTFGDFAPYIYRTGDYGRTWTRIARPEQGMRGQAWVIKEDPEKPGLLYAGTEFGLWISPDGGRRWAQFKGGDLPDVPVHDLAFQTRDHDLVIATHGRGIWIVDDLTPLRALERHDMATPLTLLPSRPAQQRIEANGGWSIGDASFRRRQPRGRRGDQLLPAAASPVRQAEDRGAGRLGQGAGDASGVQAPGRSTAWCGPCARRRPTRRPRRRSRSTRPRGPG